MSYETYKKHYNLYSKLYDLKDECIDELDTIGYKDKLGRIDEWQVNTRAKNRLGVCRHRHTTYGIKYNIIGISDWVLEKFADKDIKNVIMHELLHTIDGCNNHGELWKRYARKVSHELGYNITRTENIQALCERNGIDYSEFENNSYKYEITCKKCGATWHKHKLTKNYLFYYRNNKMTHTSCGGKEFIVKDIKLGKVIVE